MIYQKFGTLVVEDLEEEEPADKSQRPKKVCGSAAIHRRRVMLTG